MKLTGCVVRAEGGDGYLLINTPREPAATSPEPRTTAPTTLGTAGVFTNIFYWLDKDDDLMPHVGHQVEVDGDLKGELRDGQIKIDRKDQWTEIEVESDGRDMKARVPNASIVAGSRRRPQDGGAGAARRRRTRCACSTRPAADARPHMARRT